jgi:hypothetical protein
MTPAKPKPKASRRRAAPTLSRGEQLRADVLAGWELEPHEVQILAEACRALDTIDALAAVVAVDGPTVTTASGVTAVHPAIQETRLQEAIVARLLATLNLRGSDGSPALLTGMQLRSATGNSARWGDRAVTRGAS